MCAITGYISVTGTPSPSVLTTFTRLLLAGTCRGRDAAGWMAPTPEGLIQVAKAAGPPLAILDALPTTPPRWLVGHNRAKTQGTELDNCNNHPVTSGRFALVHNGVVRERLTPIGIANPVLTLPHAAEVDSQLIVEVIDTLVEGRNWSISNAIEKGIPAYLTGSIACALVDSAHPHTLHFFADGNPLVLAYDPLGGVIWFASTRAIIDSALGTTISHLNGLFVEHCPPATGSLVYSELGDLSHLTITMEHNTISWKEDSLDHYTSTPMPITGAASVQRNWGAPASRSTSLPKHCDPIDRPFPLRYTTPQQHTWPTPSTAALSSAGVHRDPDAYYDEDTGAWYPSISYED